MAGSRIVSTMVTAGLALAITGAAASADTWPKREPSAADQALAKQSIVQITDFAPGSGWSKAPASGNPGGMDDPAACNDGAFSDQGRVLTGSASSSFRATGLQIWSSADVMKTVAMAKHDADQMRSAPLKPCLNAVFTKNLPKAARLVSVKKLTFPRFGDWSDGYRALIDVTVNGTKIRLQVDMLLVLRSRIEITLMQMAPFAISSLAKTGELRLLERLAGSSLSA
jgi:hypothetical protein